MHRLAQQANGYAEEVIPTPEETPAPAQVVSREDFPPIGTPERIAMMRDIKDGRLTYRRPMTPEQEVEMLDAYTKTTEPIGKIATRYGVSATYPYNVLDRAGVSWRRGNAESFDDWQAAQQIRKEPAVTQPEQRVLPPQIEAMRNVRPIKAPVPPSALEVAKAEAILSMARANPDDLTQALSTNPLDVIEQAIKADPALPTWEIQYTGILSMLVSAPSIDEALARARADGAVVNIVSVSMRAR